MKQWWRRLHRWAGLMLAGYVVFYCVTGLLLNHRRDFQYFQQRDRAVSPVMPQDTTVLRAFIDAYKRQINRADDPRVIRIRDNGVIEFLYGAHGKTTYIIDPERGTMARVDKSERQPWHWLNRLHKSFQTSGLWLALTDVVGVLIIFLTLSGLLLFHYTRRDIWLLLGGLFVLGLGMVLA